MSGFRKFFAGLWGGPPRHLLSRSWRIEETSTLATLSICSALTVVLYLSTFALVGIGDTWTFRSARDAARPFSNSIPPYRLSGIQMGMTPIEAGSAQPSILMSGPPSGRQIGRFKIGNGDYSISFMGPGGGRKAYRIHYTETFWDFSEMEIRDSLKKKFGPPDINQCAVENAAAVWACRLRWRRGDGVVLDAVTRASLSAGGVRTTELEFTATDRGTRVHGRKPSLSRMRAISSAARGL